jgi:integrase
VASLQEFFGPDRACDEIAAHELHDYHAWYLKRWQTLQAKGFFWRQNPKKPRPEKVPASVIKKPSSLTRRTAEFEFRNILRFGSTRGWITRAQIPHIELTEWKPGERAAFNPEEVDTILAYLEKRTKTNDHWMWQRRMLLAYCRILLKTGLRPGELLAMRFQDVSEVQNQKGKEFVRFWVAGLNEGARKTGSRAVFAPSSLKPEIAWLKANHPAYRTEECMWMKPDSTPMSSFTEAFKQRLEELGLTHDQDGITRTLYSWRHTYITEAILIGIDVHKIAKNCGNTVATIEKHYAHIIAERHAHEFGSDPMAPPDDC